MVQSRLLKWTKYFHHSAHTSQYLEKPTSNRVKAVIRTGQLAGIPEGAHNLKHKLMSLLFTAIFMSMIIIAR